MHQLGVEMHRSPYGQTIRKLLLEIEPDCKDNLPKRPKADEPAPPAPPLKAPVAALPAPKAAEAAAKKPAPKKEEPAAKPATLTLEANAVRIEGVDFRTMLQLPLEMTTARDVLWLIQSGGKKLTTKPALAAAFADVAWELYLPAKSRVALKVSSIASRIDSVILSAYRMTFAFTLRAARPIV